MSGELGQGIGLVVGNRLELDSGGLELRQSKKGSSAVMFSYGR
jgi:hypothetical protein